MLPITSFVFTVFHMMFYLKVYDSIRQQNLLSNWKYILNALQKRNPRENYGTASGKLF